MNILQRNNRKPNCLCERAAPIQVGSPSASVLLFARLFPAALASQRFFYTLFLARFQVVGVSLYFLDDVFLLNLALKSAQRVLQRLTFLQSYVCQIKYTPKPS